MSCLTSLPFGRILDYWWESLQGEHGRIRFLLTKCIEVSAFRESIFRNRKRKTVLQSVRFPSKEVPNNIDNLSTAAVVVPVFLRNNQSVEMLDVLVTRLLAQKLEAHIIIVDDASPISVQNYSDVTILRLKKNNGPAAARNQGVEHALNLGADFIAFTDTDCIPSEKWLQEIHAGFINSPLCNILSGNTLSHDRCWLGKYHERNGTLNGRKIIGTDKLLYGPTCNLAITAHVAKELRFDEGFPCAAAEDIELCYRANKVGWTIEHCANAIVFHNFGYAGVSRLRAFLNFYRQFKRYSDGEALLLDRHPDYYAAFLETAEVSASKFVE